LAARIFRRPLGVKPPDLQPRPPAANTHPLSATCARTGSERSRRGPGADPGP
jgi:hypothetical protein